MIVYLETKATRQDIKNASEEYGDYIKIVVDLERKVLAMGGRLHADAEEVLLKKGSRQRDLWGGGYDINTKKVDMQAMINLRPGQGNDSMEILDPDFRTKFMKLVEDLL